MPKSVVRDLTKLHLRRPNPHFLQIPVLSGLPGTKPESRILKFFAAESPGWALREKSTRLNVRKMLRRSFS
jgi:hypothetical protein